MKIKSYRRDRSNWISSTSQVIKFELISILYSLNCDLLISRQTISHVL